MIWQGRLDYALYMSCGRNFESSGKGLDHTVRNVRMIVINPYRILYHVQELLDIASSPDQVK